MSRKLFTVLAVAVLSVSATALYYRAQIRADHERIAASERHRQEALGDTPVARIRQTEALQHHLLADMRVVSDHLFDMQQRGVLAAMPPGANRDALAAGMRKTRPHFVIPKDVFGMDDGTAIIKGAVYTLPKAGKSSLVLGSGDISSTFGPHTLRIPRNGHLLWDGGDYGPAPTSGKVVLGADGSVKVNGRPVRRLP